jgi:hypothetical protein
MRAAVPAIAAVAVEATEALPSGFALPYYFNRSVSSIFDTLASSRG